MADLTTKAKVAAYLKRALSTDESAVLDDAIPAVTAYIERMTSRSFQPDATASDRYYDIPGSPVANRMFGTYAAERITTEIVIEPASEVNSVTYVAPNGGGLGNYTYVENVDYVVLPRQAGKTKRSILFYHGIPGGIEALKVNGKWGETAPADLIMAATALVAGLLHNPFGLQRRQIEGYMEMYGKVADANPFIQQAIESNTRAVF